MRRAWAALIPLFLAGLLASCGDDGLPTLTVYAGHHPQLMEEVMNRFAEQEGIKVRLRIGDPSSLANAIIEEGENSPADVFISEGAAALGALAEEGRLVPLPADVLEQVPEWARDRDGRWVGFGGRARVLVYNPERVRREELPQSVFDLTEPQWRGRVGWAPANPEFQNFVTAMRLLHGEDATRAWLLAMKENGVREYPNNITIVDAVADGEIDVGLVNHYYLYAMRADRGSLNAENFYFTNGDVGGLVNVSGAGIVDSSDQAELGRRLIEFLLTPEIQALIAEEGFEYPLVPGAPTPPGAPAIEELQPPDVDLSALRDLRGTVRLLQETGVLP
mgnify:CR=1 FL=1